MFYHFSKVFWLFAEPANFLVMLCLVGTLFLWTPWWRSARAVLSAAIFAIVFVSLVPVGQLMIAELETRFPEWRDNGGDVAGIVVLGGAIDPDFYARHRGSGFNGAISRITEAAALAKRYRSARVIYAGGSPGTERESLIEAEAAREVFAMLGVDESQLSLDLESRNTYENAYFAKKIAQPKAGERWILVTSAFHMPRAMGTFRAVDFPVEPYPVDFRTAGFERAAQFDPGVLQGLSQTATASRELVGLAAYRLTKRIPDFYPAPAVNWPKIASCPHDPEYYIACHN